MVFVFTALPSLVKQVLRGEKSKKIQKFGSFRYKMRCQNGQDGTDIFLFAPYFEGGEKRVLMRFRLLRDSQLSSEEISIYQKVNDKKHSQRFLHELENWKYLLEQNISNILPMQTQGKGVLTPWISRGSLTRVLQNGAIFSTKKIAQLAIQIITTLEEMHKKKVVHLDIKRCNILLDKEDLVKVIDFGHALPIGDILRTFGWATRPYTPPEQFESQWQVCPSMDIWSFGLLLFEMSHGSRKNPFLQNQFPEKDFQNPSKYQEIKDTWEKSHLSLLLTLNMANSLDTLIRKSLSWTPSSRPTATQVKADLESIINNPS